MAAVHLIGLDPETLPGVAPRPVGSEHPVVPAQQVPRRHLRPGVERPGLPQRFRLLVTLPSPGLGCELRRDVVVEDVVVPARDVAGVRPPVVEELAGQRDHCGHEDEQIDAQASADERRGERAERMADDDHVPLFADRAYDLVRVVAPAGGWVLARKVDRHRLVPALAQLGDDQMPVPRAAAAAVDQDEGRHVRAG